MSLYSYVADVVVNIEIGQLVTIDKPDKLRAFRKFLSEISKKDHKKFTTKLQADKLHIMRIRYYSVSEKLQSE